MILRAPVLDTSELALEKLGSLAVTVALPMPSPRTLPFTDRAPCGIVTVGVTTAMFAGTLLARLTVTPPAGAGLGMLMGNETVCPNGTFSVAGTVRMLCVAVMDSVPSL